MRKLLCSLLLVGGALVPSPARAADAPPEKLPVELTGRVEGHRFIRDWASYYWREDFTFLLKDDRTGRTWRIISREPTPAYKWRLGTTYTGLKVDWKKRPRVRVVGVTGVDRQPARFYDLELKEPHLATAFVVWVETKPDEWREYYVNNWFHKWGPKVDPVIHKLYADRPAPYDIYGFINGQAAPFSKGAQGILARHPKARMFHGLIHSTRDNKFGYQIDLLHLIGPDAQGSGVVMYGDPKTMVPLDQKKPPEKKDEKREESDKKKPLAARFTDVTAASGLRIVKDAKAHAVAVEDFDGDGLPDILVATFDPPHIQYFRNLGKLRFQDVTRDSGLKSFDGTGSGFAVGDFNRDGKLDVYLTSVRGGPSRLYQGKGDGTFVDVSAKSGTLLKAPARCCAWSDIDGDGWLDLYVTSPEGANRLFRNNRDGTFTDIAKEAGVDLADRHSLGCAFGDVDGDGRDDLFVANYQSQVSALFRNLGRGKFQDVTRTAGLDRRASAVGCVFADVFNKGRFDLYLTTDSWLSGANYTEPELLKMKHTVEPNILYVNDGKGRFSALESADLAYKSLSHDAILEDLDHDGLIDIYVGVDAESGNHWATSKGGNPLWTRRDGRTWTEAGKVWSIKHEANCVCVPAVDFDNDGDLDLLLVNFYSNVVLYRNETNDSSWLRVKAIGTTSNPDGIGARISVFAPDGRLVGMRHIQSGSGYCRSSPLEAHFGLGKKAAEYRVEVFFPAMSKRVVREHVQSGRRIVIKETESR